MGSLNVPEKSDATVWPQQARDPVLVTFQQTKDEFVAAAAKRK